MDTRAQARKVRNVGDEVNHPPPQGPPAPQGPPPNYPPPPPAEAFSPSPPAYGAPPPAYGAPPPVSPRGGGLRTLVAVIVVVALVLGAVVAYGVAGFAVASSRISSASKSLNSVIDHENTITKSFNDLADQIAKINLNSSTTAADLKTYRGLADQLVSASQGALPTVAGDDASLASAAAALKEHEWLTVLSKSRIDDTSSRLGHARKALNDAKTIASGYVQLGGYYQSFFDGNIDLSAIGVALSANDLTAATSATSTLKADAAKGLALATAPGLPAEVKEYQTDLAKLADDFGRLLVAVAKGDSTNGGKLLKTVEAEATKVDSYDWSAISDKINAFYKPLIDDYNTEGHRATA